MSDYEIDDLPCPSCGNDVTHSRHCTVIHCDDAARRDDVQVSRLQWSVPGKEAGMTRTELLQIRDSTHRGPQVPEKRCDTCRHNSYVLDGVVRCIFRDVMKLVHPLGLCDLWEEKR